MDKYEMKNRISMALKDPILQQGFEIICKNLAELEKENAELKGQISAKDILIKELQEQKVYWKESSFDWRHKFFKLDKVKRLIKKDKRIEALEKDKQYFSDSLDKQIEATLKLQQENAELNEKLSEQKQYTAFKCNEFVKKKEVYEKEHFLLTNAKEIIKKLKALYFSPVVTKDDVKRQDEILAEVEQFLNGEVEK